MKHFTPGTMQFIPSDWQDTVELHIVAINSGAANNIFKKQSRPEGLTGNFRVACNDLVEHIEDTFGSVHNFDRFLQVDLLNRVSRKGYEGAPSQTWNAWPRDEENVEEVAGTILETYTQIYKRALWEIESLPPAPAAF